MSDTTSKMVISSGISPTEEDPKVLMEFLCGKGSTAQLKAQLSQKQIWIILDSVPGSEKLFDFPHLDTEERQRRQLGALRLREWRSSNPYWQKQRTEEQIRADMSLWESYYGSCATL